MITIILGRDPKTSNLKLTADNKSTLFNSKVPASVSSEHCAIDISEEGIRVRNLDINNYTYVNQRAVESLAISKEDVIELGPDRYQLPWQAIDHVVPPTADIRPLQKVWAKYDEHRLDQQIADRRFNSLRSATGLITMGAIALSMLTGRQSLWFIVLYVVAILISLAFTIKAYKDASAIPQKAQLLNRLFQKDYVCPHCKHFLGNQPYDLLAQNDHCPYCKIHFIH